MLDSLRGDIADGLGNIFAASLEVRGVNVSPNRNVNLTASGNITVPGAGFTGGTNVVAGTVNMPNDLNTASDAQTTLTYINQAISDVASQRGNIGAEINRLQAASNVESVQVQNLTSAEDSIMAANIPQQVTNLSEYSILNQSGISALAQANSAQQSILKLLQ